MVLRVDGQQHRPDTHRVGDLALRQTGQSHGEGPHGPGLERLVEALSEVDRLRRPLGHVDGTAQDEGVIAVDDVDVLGALDVNIDLRGLEAFGDHRSHLIGGTVAGGRGKQNLHAA